MNDSSESSSHRDGGGRWLFLVHQLPAEPAYLRVKVSRRLRGLGALALKSSVYLLPASAESREDFAWLRREITAGGGDATILEGSFVEGISDGEVVRRFSAERDREYGEVTAELTAPEGGEGVEGVRESDVKRMRKRLAAIRERDFFGAGGRFAAERALRELEEGVHGTGGLEEGAMAERPVGAVWVTRRGMKVDRLASAWLIRRFLDPEARFKYVSGEGYRPEPGEVRFDMYEGEYTHEGDRCTFEVLVDRFGLGVAGLREIGEVVHDLDFKDEKFGRPECAGVGSVVAGLVAAHAEDEERRMAGERVFDALLAGFGRGAGGG